MTPAVPPALATKPRRHGCLLLLAIAVGGLLCAGALFTWWLRSDRDLDGLRRELQAEHLPTTWEELDLQLSPPATLATWKRVGELSKLLTSFNSAHLSFGGTTASLTAFEPVPDAARIHHAMLDQDRLSELRACVDALGDQRLEVRTVSDLSTNLGELGVARGVLALLAEDALLADPMQVAAACRRLLRFVAIQPRGMMLSHICRIGLIEVAFTTVSGRLESLKRGPQRVDDLVEALAAGAVAELPDMETREMLGAWATFAKRPTSAHDFAIFDVRWLDDCLRPTLLRAGRAGLLRHEAALTRRYAQPLGAAGPNALITALEQEGAAGGHSSPAGFLIALNSGFEGLICRTSHECRLHGLLLLAELRGQPWPVDSFDPAHLPLRALVRAGRTVGAYSLGSTAVDHLGKRPNHYWPLLERLEPLKPPPP